jgi:hypothetical protein
LSRFGIVSRLGDGLVDCFDGLLPIVDWLLLLLDCLFYPNLTGDYLWRSSVKVGAGKFMSLRPLQPAKRALLSVF